MINIKRLKHFVNANSGYFNMELFVSLILLIFTLKLVNYTIIYI